MEERKVIVSRIKTPDWTILESKHVHDYVAHMDANGELYFLDGGNEYMRTSINNESWEDWSIYSDYPYDIIRMFLKRGTFNTKGERIWIPLCKMTDEHLKNIFTYNEQYGLSGNWFEEYIKKELEYRKAKGISIPEGGYDDIEIEN